MAPESPDKGVKEERTKAWEKVQEGQRAQGEGNRRGAFPFSEKVLVTPSISRLRISITLAPKVTPRKKFKS